MITAVDWVTVAYLTPVIIGVAVVIGFLVWHSVIGRRVHSRTELEPELLRTPVRIRRAGINGKWSGKLGLSTIGSKPTIDLVIKDHLIEIVYVGRPLGGIGGTRWFFAPERTELVTTSPDGVPDRARHEILLTERGTHSRLVIDPGAAYETVIDTLQRVGARRA